MLPVAPFFCLESFWNSAGGSNDVPIQKATWDAPDGIEPQEMAAQKENSDGITAQELDDSDGMASQDSDGIAAQELLAS